MLYLSKITKLDAIFDALKSHVTCELSNEANKLDSISLVLHKTLKTLQQCDVRNSKLHRNILNFFVRRFFQKMNLLNT